MGFAKCEEEWVSRWELLVAISVNVRLTQDHRT